MPHLGRIPHSQISDGEHQTVASYSCGAISICSWCCTFQPRRDPATNLLSLDTSFYGRGTLPRLENSTRRVCGWEKITDCPHSSYEDSAIRNKYSNSTVVNSTIPFTTLQPFTSRAHGNTISSPMDIEYRNYHVESKKHIDNDAANIRGNIQPFETFLLDDKYRLIEGLVIDAIDGGLGFRNHTVPVGLPLGADWEEDLLWITPETSCTSINLSLHFSISEDSFFVTNNGYMTDDGGFANLNPDVPLPRWDGLENDWQDVFGATPDLHQRSYALAWWNNQFTAKALNVSSSSVGKRFTNELSNYAQLVSPSSITISEVNGRYLDSIYYSNYTASANEFKEYGAREQPQ